MVSLRSGRTYVAPAAEQRASRKKKKKKTQNGSSLQPGVVVAAAATVVGSSASALSWSVHNSRGLVLQTTDQLRAEAFQTALQLFAINVNTEVKRFAAAHGLQVNAAAMQASVAQAVLDSFVCDADRAEQLIVAMLPVHYSVFVQQLPCIAAQHGISRSAVAKVAKALFGSGRLLKREHDGMVVWQM